MKVIISIDKFDDFIKLSELRSARYSYEGFKFDGKEYVELFLTDYILYRLVKKNLLDEETRRIFYDD